MTPKAYSAMSMNFAKDAPPAIPHRVTMVQRPVSSLVANSQATSGLKRESLGRELSEATPGHREAYKKMNAVKRISRNSIVLFAFSGRSKKNTNANKAPATAGSTADSAANNNAA